MADTVTFEQAKTLKEAGLRFPESYFVYDKWKSRCRRRDTFLNQIGSDCPNTSDLADLLPSTIKQYRLFISKINKSYRCFYEYTNDSPLLIATENFPDLTTCLFSTVLWAKENGHLEGKE